jgi:hypothetical protein
VPDSDPDKSAPLAGGGSVPSNTPRERTQAGHLMRWYDRYDLVARVIFDRKALAFEGIDYIISQGDGEL